MPTTKFAERTSESWFQEAERTYTEKHQGCPWCGGSHRVFCQRRGAKVIFYCQACDFQVTHDTAANSFAAVPGLAAGENLIPETMHGLPKTLSS